MNMIHKILRKVASNSWLCTLLRLIVKTVQVKLLPSTANFYGCKKRRHPGSIESNTFQAVNNSSIGSDIRLIKSDLTEILNANSRGYRYKIQFEVQNYGEEQADPVAQKFRLFNESRNVFFLASVILWYHVPLYTWYHLGLWLVVHTAPAWGIHLSVNVDELTIKLVS